MRSGGFAGPCLENRPFLKNVLVSSKNRVSTGAKRSTSPEIGSGGDGRRVLSALSFPPLGAPDEGAISALALSVKDDAAYARGAARLSALPPDAGLGRNYVGSPTSRIIVALSDAAAPNLKERVKAVIDRLPP